MGRLLRRLTEDRLRAEALHIVVLTGGGLGWLMSFYMAEALSEWTALSPLTVWPSLGAAGLLMALVGFFGVRPRTVITCGPRAVHIERGGERLRLPVALLDHTEVVSSQVYHRRYRHCAALRPFLNSGDGPVLLLHPREGPGSALELRETHRDALQAHLSKARRPASEAAEIARS